MSNKCANIYGLLLGGTCGGDCSCMNALNKQKYALKINNNIQNNLNKLNYFK